MWQWHQTTPRNNLSNGFCLVSAVFYSCIFTTVSRFRMVSLFRVSVYFWRPDTATDNHPLFDYCRCESFILFGGVISFRFDLPLFIWMFGFWISFRHVVYAALFFFVCCRSFGFYLMRGHLLVSYHMASSALSHYFKRQATIVKKLSPLICTIFAVPDLIQLG